MIQGRSRARKQEINANESVRSKVQGISVKYKTLMVSVAVAVGAMIALAAATYAWFTAEALTRASSVTTGFMNAEVLLPEFAVAEIMVNDPDSEWYGKSFYDISPEDIEAYAASKELEKYTAKFRATSESSEHEETSYIVTDKDISLITLDHVEPGQVYPVNIGVANTGELAFTYSAAFDVEKSITGIERLKEETEAGQYGVTDNPEAEDYYQNNSEWKMKNRILRKAQIETDPETGEEADTGGHLEDVLKVYIGMQQSDITEENYVGTISEIINRTSGEGESPVSTASPAFTGYLLPRSVVTDDEGYLNPVDVTIEYEDGISKTLTNVNNMDVLHFLIVAPEDMDNKYQYASVGISLGAYATQVEYEMDGLGCRIYDRGADGRDYVIAGQEIE